MANKLDSTYRQGFQNPETARHYSDKITQTKYITLIYNLEKLVLEELFKSIGSNSLSVMDFACGSGRWTAFIEKYFRSTIGVDISASMVDIAKERTREATYVVADITTGTLPMELEGVKFDVITAFRFYKNAEQSLRVQATKELAKMVKPGGYFIFDLHLNPYSFVGVCANLINFLKLPRILKFNPRNTRTMSLGAVRRLFRECGSEFEVVDFYGTGLLPGRSNFAVLPFKLLARVESFITRRKILRSICYNQLVIAKRK